MNSHLPIILYVEDDPGSRDVMLMLADVMQTWHLTLFEDSRDFMARVQQLKPAPNLILLDIHVRPYSGLEMLTQLRADPRFTHTPILALTASVMNEEVEQLRSSGFDGVVPKPVDIDRFPVTVQRVLAGEKVWQIG